MCNGYEIIDGKWNPSNIGFTAKARKGGEKYFVKRYRNPVSPLKFGLIKSEGLPSKLKGTTASEMDAAKLEDFTFFCETRKKINEIIRKRSGLGGNIIIPCDEFVLENNYYEATPFIEGAVSDDDIESVLASLPVDQKKLLMETAAGALAAVHSAGIIHSDLKLKNVLLVRNRYGNYVAKLIDFDSSYFVDSKPKKLTGDNNYFSPELGSIPDAEPENEEEKLEVQKMKDRLTFKSDIFSLGLIYHKYLSGEFPASVPESLPKELQIKLEKKRKSKSKIKDFMCWVTLINGGRLQLSPKIKDEKYVSLISDMLSLNPEARPTAEEVLQRLKGILKVSTTGTTIEKTVEKPKAETPTTKAEIPSGFCEPWPEHNIEFNEDTIKKAGYVSAEQVTSKLGIKEYAFYKSDSSSSNFKPDILLLLKFARKKSAGSAESTSKPITPVKPLDDKAFEMDPPWPEDKIVFDEEAVKKQGFVKIKRLIKEDKTSNLKGDNFIKTDGSAQFVLVQMAILSRMAKKCESGD